MMRRVKKLIKIIGIALSPSFAERVANDYWQNTIKTHGDISEKAFDFYYQNIKILMNLKRADLILDFGGGNGELAYRFKRDGFNIDHFDISKKMRQNAKKIYNLNSLEEFELYERKSWYDNILFNNAFFYIHPKKSTTYVKCFTFF